MQQKIQFIAALLHEPDLIIMDEPFSGLDPVNATLLMDTLVSLRGEGKAILFSTHRMDQVEKLCDAIALISRGKASSVRPHARRSNRATRATACRWSSEGPDAFLCRHASVAEAKNYSGIAENPLSNDVGARAAACCTRPSPAARTSRALKSWSPRSKKFSLKTFAPASATRKPEAKSMHNILLIARREYLERIRAKSFLIMTILIPGADGRRHYARLATVLMSRNDGHPGSTSPSSLQNPAASRHDLQSGDGGRKRYSANHERGCAFDPATEAGWRKNLDKPRSRDKSSKLDGYLVHHSRRSKTPRGPTVRMGSPDHGPTAVIATSSTRKADGLRRAALTREQLTSHRVMASRGQIDALMQPVDNEHCRGLRRQIRSRKKRLVASAYGMFFLMYFIILFYGMNVARSIIEEKTSRIFEVLLATIKPDRVARRKRLSVSAQSASHRSAYGSSSPLARSRLQLRSAATAARASPSAAQAADRFLGPLLPRSGITLYSSVRRLRSAQ